MTAFYAPDPINSTQFIPGGNTPASGALLFCYQVGSSTKQNTYTDATASTARTNPIVLDSGGNIPGNGEVWIASTAKFVLAPFNDTDPPVSPYWSRDNLPGVNDPSQSGGEWIASGLTPTFVNGSTFTFTGDQTQTFTSGRRLRTINTAGTLYSTIGSSIFATSTNTLVIQSDTTGIDSGLSSVSYGIINPNHDSLPNVVSVKRFGAKGDGVTDDTAAINLAIASVNALPSGGELLLPTGNYKVTSALTTISVNGVVIRGQGSRNTKITVVPSAGFSVFKFSSGASVINYCAAKGIQFTSADTTFLKTAVEFDDASNCIADDIVCGPSGQWSGAGSTGILFKGREATVFSRVQLYCDQPILFAANPNAVTTQADHIVLRDTYLVAPLAGTFPVVGAATGATIKNLSTEGYNVWVGGSGGFVWLDTTGALNSQNLSFKNVRWEQSTVSGAYLFDIESAGGINTVRIENCSSGTGATTKGIKLRTVNRITIADSAYGGTSEAFNADSTCQHIIFDNFRAFTGSTATLTGLSQVFGSPLDAGDTLFAPFAIYEPTTNTNPVIIGAKGTETPWTATLTGCTTAPTVTVVAIRQGNVVTLDIPTITATSNSTAKTLTGMPSSFRPTQQIRGFLYLASDNGGANVMGEAWIEANGVIDLFPNLAVGNWTNAGVFTASRIHLTYPATA